MEEKGKMGITEKTAKGEKRGEKNERAKTGDYPQTCPRCGKSYSVIHCGVDKLFSKKRIVDRILKIRYNEIMMKAPDFEKIKELYRENREAFERFRALLTEYNAKYNLTSIVNEEEILYKHFFDSLAGEAWFKQGAAVCEVGSGGGFPSIPLKIARRDLQFTLLESTGKKCEFLRAVARELQLENVEIVCARAEEAAHEERYREKFDVCCARAVARLNTLAEYCLPFVKKGGIFLAYKGESSQERKEARNAVFLLGGSEPEFAEYTLGEYGARSLVCVQKRKTTPVLYPRGHGKERTKPL